MTTNGTTSSSSSSSSSSKVPTLTPEEAENALTSFSKIIQFQTVSATAPFDGEYVKCAAYIMEQLRSIPCLDKIHILEESPDHSPVVIARWKGTDSMDDKNNDNGADKETLPIILLNSHYDVVPAVQDDWKMPCFEGLRKDGRVYGRGAQDMKCVCIQYMEAIRKLHKSKPDYIPSRSIYLSFVPDEEVGGSGMAALLSSKLYKSLPGIAIALDEGLANTDNSYSVFYGERLPWWVEVKATGNTGHGSRFIEHTAVEQIIELSNRALAFREGQRVALHGSSDDAKHSNCAHAVAAKKRRLRKEEEEKKGAGTGNKMSLGDVTSLNITTLQAGVRAGDTFVTNCVPPLASCSLDIRISPHVKPVEIKNMLDGWCRECSASEQDGHTLSWEYIGGQGNDLQKHALTSTDTKVNPWYGVFGETLESMGVTYAPEVFPAATDSRFLRCLGIRALGFSPMRNSEIMLHENDEYLEECVFLEGVGVYVGLIEALGKQGSEFERMDISAD